MLPLPKSVRIATCNATDMWSDVLTLRRRDYGRMFWGCETPTNATWTLEALIRRAWLAQLHPTRISSSTMSVIPIVDVRFSPNSE
jgi:hypothetical protein